MKKGLNAFELKLIAAAAMLINHLSHIVVLLPINHSVMNMLIVPMNIIGKLTIPIMCFFVAEGYFHTSNLKKYLQRMFIFAAVSQVPFYLFESYLPSSFSMFIGDFIYLNAIFSLAMGLLALTVRHSERLHPAVKIAVIAVIVFLTRTADWRVFAVLWILAFAEFRGDFKKQAAAFVILSAVRVFIYYVLPSADIMTVVSQSCTAAALVPLYFYNGRQGPKTKYGFYIFYPAHLLVLAVIKFIILGV